MDSGCYIVVLFIFGLISKSFSQSIIQITEEKHPSGPADRILGGRLFRRDDSLYCDSWRYSVETNDAGKWSQIPAICREFVQEYMTGDRYLSDSEVVANISLEFAKTVEIAGDGKDAWVFDIDETLLTNEPYYEQHGFGRQSFSYTPALTTTGSGPRNHPTFDIGDSLHGECAMLTDCNSKESHISNICDMLKWWAEPFDEKSFDDWVDLAEAPALPASLKLYKELKQLGFTIFLLTGRDEHQRNVTMKNLLYAGYTNWERLILRGASDRSKPAIVYKSEKRREFETEGYTIHGSSGDQWSDLYGFAVATRSFKLPNPMYYVA